MLRSNVLDFSELLLFGGLVQPEMGEHGGQKIFFKKFKMFEFKSTQANVDYQTHSYVRQLEEKRE